MKNVHMLKTIQIKKPKKKKKISLFLSLIFACLNRVVIGYDKGTVTVKVVCPHSGVSMGSLVKEKEKKEL